MRFLFWVLVSWPLAVQAERVLQVATVSPERHVADAAEVRYLGQVEALHQVGLGFELAGRIAELPILEGQSVSEGQLIARLDTGLVERQLDEVLAAQAQVEATIELAGNTLQRLTEARDRGAITDQQLDEARDRLTQAQAQRKLIRAQRARVELQQQKHELRAPYDGVVLGLAESEGSVVNPGAPVAQFQSQALQVRLGLPSRQRVQVGDQFSAPGQQRFTVVRVVPKRDPRSGLQDVLLAPSESFAQIAGDWISLSPPSDMATPVLSLPTSAVTRLAGQWGAYRITPASRVEFVAISVTGTRGDRIEFSGGLTEADVVVANGLHRMVPDQAIAQGE